MAARLSRMKSRCLRCFVRHKSDRAKEEIKPGLGSAMRSSARTNSFMSTNVRTNGMTTWDSRFLSRRQMLGEFGGGLAGIAFTWLLARDAVGGTPRNFDLVPKTPHFKPRARNIIFLYMGGGPSQMDLFDPKPALSKYDGQPIPVSITQRAIRGSTKLMASPFKFAKYGRAGIDLSELLPHFAEVVDEAAIVRSGVTTRID